MPLTKTNIEIKMIFFLQVPRNSHLQLSQTPLSSHTIPLCFLPTRALRGPKNQISMDFHEPKKSNFNGFPLPQTDSKDLP